MITKKDLLRFMIIHLKKLIRKIISNMLLLYSKCEHEKCVRGWGVGVRGLEINTNKAPI